MEDPSAVRGVAFGAYALRGEVHARPTSHRWDHERDTSGGGLPHTVTVES